MTVILCEALDTVARLSAQGARSYEKVKQSLPIRFHSSAEAFRLRFRNGEGRSASKFAEPDFHIEANLREWMKSAEAFEDADKSSK